MNIAIITARGGSRRIPGKNIRSFCGKPIMIYSIDAAKQSGMFDVVMVSTDDGEIAHIAREAGAEVPFMRSDAASSDYATTSDVLREVLEEYRRLGREFELAACLYPTAPFVTAHKLTTAAQLLKNHPEADTVMPVVRFSFPPQRGVYLENGFLVKADPASYGLRSQDLRPVYHDCGQFYLFRPDRFCTTGQLIGEKVIPMEMKETEVQDIDNETDWQLAEIKFRLMKG